MKDELNPISNELEKEEHEEYKVKLKDVQEREEDRKELPGLSKTEKNKKKFTMESIITYERGFDLICKYIVVVFIGYILFKQIKFINDIILGVANGELQLDSNTMQIVVSATIIEFIFAIKIVINSLFPANDREKSLDFLSINRKNKEGSVSLNKPQSDPDK